MRPAASPADVMSCTCDGHGRTLVADRVEQPGESGASRRQVSVPGGEVDVETEHADEAPRRWRLGILGVLGRQLEIAGLERQPRAEHGEPAPVA